METITQKTISELREMPNDYSPINDHLFEIAQEIERSGEITAKAVEEMQNTLSDCCEIAARPLKFPLLDYVDDIEHYTYMCVIHKKCAVCGKRAELHHIDAIGMGNDRNDVQHLGREVISLCREHHAEYHTVGKSEFMTKYHLSGGVTADKTILKIYGLKR